MARVAIFNCKGGVGKTTTTLNLAAANQRAGRQTRVIDLDPQAHLTRIYDVLPRDPELSGYALYTSAVGVHSLEVKVDAIGSLVPAHGNLMKADSAFGKGPAVLNRLRTALDMADATEPKTTFIDCCPFLGVLSLSAIFAADFVLVPVSADYLSMQGAHQIAHALNALQPVLKKRVARRFLLTRFDRRRRMSEEIRQTMHEIYPGEVCETVIAECTAVATSPSLGQDIYSYQPSSTGAHEYTAVYEELKAAKLI